LVFAVSKWLCYVTCCKYKDYDENTALVRIVASKIYCVYAVLPIVNLA
jgi:hypothetical protein